LKIERIDKTRLDYQVVEDTIKTEGFSNAEFFEMNGDFMECITNESGLWNCIIDNENVKDIETINFLGQNENNITLHKYNNQQRISNQPRKDLKCIVGRKYSNRGINMLCGTIEDFSYFILPAYKLTLDKD